MNVESQSSLSVYFIPASCIHAMMFRCSSDILFRFCLDPKHHTRQRLLRGPWHTSLATSSASSFQRTLDTTTTARAAPMLPRMMSRRMSVA